MKTRPLSRPCPLCSCRSGLPVHTQDFALTDNHPLQSRQDVVICSECGFGFADTEVPQSRYDDYYSAMSKYADNASSTGGGAASWDAERLTFTAQRIRQFIGGKPARIVDIGCANGGLVGALKKEGFLDVCGIDPSPKCVEHVRSQFQADAWVGTLSNLPADTGKFDGVLLSHVMEHVRDLESAMERVHALLHESGWVYVEVPDAGRYSDFLVSPFQDFNLEHINHFTLGSLGNLFRCSGFIPAELATKDIFSAKDMPYPAIFGFAQRGSSRVRPTRDVDGPKNIHRYVERSEALMRELDRQLKRVVDAHPRVIIWGTGQLTLKLLVTTSLSKAAIECFVDSNPVNVGKRLLGTTVLHASELQSSSIPILVGSIINAESIVNSIRSRGITNPVITLDSPAQAARTEHSGTTRD